MTSGGEGGGGEGGGGVVVDVVEEILLRCQQDILNALGNGNLGNGNLYGNVTGDSTNLEEHHSGSHSTDAPGMPEWLEHEDYEGYHMGPSAHPTATPPAQYFPEEYSICDHCNFTDRDLEVLINSGTCTPSDFSSYMPLIYQMYACIFVIALLGNTLVLYIVVSNRKMHTVTNLFIANLAVGDLLIMVFCVPFSVASIIVLQYWPFGEVLCVFVNYSQIE